MKKTLNLIMLTCLVVGTTASLAEAAGTIAGTPISNTATVNYNVDGIDLEKDSDTVTFNVAELLDVTLVSRDGSNVPVKPGESKAMLTYELTNTGNYQEGFTLTVDNTDTTDDFDPETPTTIYFDANDNDTYDDGTDTLYDGSNLPALAADESIHLFVFNDIPDTPADTELGISNLQADAQTGTGPEGTAYANAGYNGSVVAVVGTSGASANADGTYQVSRVDVTIDKTGVVIEDGLTGTGTEPVPGATIEYTITVEVVGGTAAGLVITDPIPAATTYVADSMELNGSPLTDDPSDDEGTLAEPTTDNFEIQVDLGDVVGGAAPGTTNTITFEVTIK
ncbi:hypothetical protein [Desulfosediminicola sp.]|uniref:hypothetical protein n=1 Tax=Desulfosediminicola sp. TaxID=2886825 RepID=UPI003AF2C63A